MAVEIRMPRLNWSQETGTVARWLKARGEYVKAGELLLVVETEKAEVEVEADESGILYPMAPEQQTLPVGSLIGYLLAQGEEVPARTAHGPAVPVHGLSVSQESTPPERDRLPAKSVSATPLARRVAKEHNVDLSEVTGSGPGGGVTERDVLRHVEAHGGGVSRPSEAMASRASGVPTSPLNSIRKATAERLAASFSTAPHFYLGVTVDFTRVNQARQSLTPPPSFTAFLVRAVAVALSRHPEVNVSYRDGGLIRHSHINVGIATATPDGLLVPVIRDADRLGVVETDLRLGELRQKAEKRRFKGEEFSGGTFTLSNLGMLGIEEFLAVINPPEAAILAVGAIVDRPYPGLHGIELRPSVKLNLSIDHRALDGAEAARFLSDLKSVIENPEPVT